MEYEPLSAFQGQTLEVTEVKITGEEPVMKQYFYTLSLHLCKNHLHFGKDAKAMSSEGVGKFYRTLQRLLKLKATTIATSVT